MRELTFLEFFAGGGMARAGLGEGWRCLFANDFDEAKANAYAAAWGGNGQWPSELWVGDVGELAIADLPAEQADLAWASFPCQDLSLAGNGAGLAGERSGSFLPFYFLMKRLREVRRAPRTIVLENVCGLLTSHGGRDFADICSMLGKIGYRYGALIIDAVHFLPQSRPRLFVVAVDRDLAVTSSTTESLWHPARLIEAQNSLNATCKQDWIWFNPPRPPRRNEAFGDLIEDVPTGVEWHSFQETARLLDMMNDVNRAKVEAALGKSVRSVGTVYKRTRVENGIKRQRAEVRFDGVSGCLRTPGGGSSRQTIVIVEDGQVRTRLISARETARLMGLDDQFPLPKRYNDAYHLTGDGVAVPVVRYIAEWILEPILYSSELELAAA